MAYFITRVFQRRGYWNYDDSLQELSLLSLELFGAIKDTYTPEEVRMLMVALRKEKYQIDSRHHHAMLVDTDGSVNDIDDTDDAYNMEVQIHLSEVYKEYTSVDFETWRHKYLPGVTRLRAQRAARRLFGVKTVNNSERAVVANTARWGVGIKLTPAEVEQLPKYTRYNYRKRGVISEKTYRKYINK